MLSSTARVLGLSLLALLAAAPTATAAEGWTVAPAGGGRPTFYAEGEPGTPLQDTVSVTNPTTHPVTVRLRATGIPITFADTGVRVPARTRADIPFTVNVPTTAAPGDHTATIVARDARGREVTARLQLHVSGPMLSALTIEHVAVHGDRITYELVNRGTTPSPRNSPSTPPASSAPSWTAPPAPSRSNSRQANASSSPNPGPTTPPWTRSTYTSRSRRQAAHAIRRTCRHGSCRGERWRGPGAR